MIGVKVAVSSSRLVASTFLFQDSIADLVTFEASRLLRRYPDLNAFYLDDRTLGYYEEVHFGISFDGGRDLKVLSLRNADTLSLAETQAGIESLLYLYESGAPIADDLLTTSTVTLSDLSRSKVEFMLPLLNGDQSLILGVTRAQDAGFMVYGSFDHRVSEGLQVARFLDELSERIQSHYRGGNVAMDGSRDLRCSACDRSVQEELNMGGRGLVRVALPDGSDALLCRVCFHGWQ